MSEKDVRKCSYLIGSSARPWPASCTSPQFNAVYVVLCPAPSKSTLRCDGATRGRGQAALGTRTQRTICLSPGPEQVGVAGWTLVRDILVWWLRHQDIIMCWLRLVIIAGAGDGQEQVMDMDTSQLQELTLR